jgi:hypothetical protein
LTEQKGIKVKKVRVYIPPEKRTHPGELGRKNEE